MVTGRQVTPHHHNQVTAGLTGAASRQQPQFPGAVIANGRTQPVRVRQGQARWECLRPSPALGDTVLSAPSHRTYCARRANHQDPVTTSHLAGGEPWIRREGARPPGDVPQIQGRYRDITSIRRRPARLRADPPVGARPGPQRPGLLRRARRAEPVLGHRRRLPLRVPGHPRRRGAVRRAAEHRRQPATGRRRDRRRRGREQHRDAPGLLPPPRRPRRGRLAVRECRPDRARGDPAAAAPGRRPGPAAARRDLRRHATRWRSAASASSWPGAAPTTRRTTSTSTSPATTP